MTTEQREQWNKDLLSLTKDKPDATTFFKQASIPLTNVTCSSCPYESSMTLDDEQDKLNNTFYGTMFKTCAVCFLKNNH